MTRMPQHTTRERTDRLGPTAGDARRSLNSAHAGDVGIALPPFIDHHVHLQLTDARQLAAGGIAGVVDLGANPSIIADIAARRQLPHVRHAGQFLTAPGGYPSNRSWAPAGSVRTIAAMPSGSPDAHHRATPDAVHHAVDEHVRFGASVIKVALNADAGPIFDLATLSAIVDAAHERALPVVAHAEGASTVELALDAGVDALAHTPWTHPLDAATTARAAASQAWVSTLDIHSRSADTTALPRAIDNLARFAAAGGRVLYGTDLGNGELPIGINAREIDALVRGGIAASDIVAALTDSWPHTRPDDWRAAGVATFVPGSAPSTPEALGAWLATAHVVPTEELEHL